MGTMQTRTLSVRDKSKSQAFVVPVKCINEGHHVQRFLVSKAYRDIMIFVLQLNRAMFPRLPSNVEEQLTRRQTWELDSSNVTLSEAIQRLQRLLAELNTMVDEVPPDPGPRRFGNIAFRRWYELVEARLPALLQRHLPEKVLSFKASSSLDAKDELQLYLLGALGSAQRLDYGTGHELSFLAFLAGIWKLDGFGASSNGNQERGIVLGVFEP